jgi:hypothetical protein
LENELKGVLRENQQQVTNTSFVVNELANIQRESERQETRIAFLESENSIMRSKMNDMNSTSTFLLQQNAILEEKLNFLNATCNLVQQNMTTPGDIKKMEEVLAFEMEQTIRDSEQKIMVNVSATIKDLQLRDRYLSLSLLDAHNATSTLKTSLHTEISKLDASLSKLQSTCTYNSLVICSFVL